MVVVVVVIMIRRYILVFHSSTAETKEKGAVQEINDSPMILELWCNCNVIGFIQRCFVFVVSVDTPDEMDGAGDNDEDDIDSQKNLAFLLEKVEGCAVRGIFILYSFDIYC